jgi:hypothetical protein
MELRLFSFVIIFMVAVLVGRITNRPPLPVEDGDEVFYEDNLLEIDDSFKESILITDIIEPVFVPDVELLQGNDLLLTPYREPLTPPPISS